MDRFAYEHIHTDAQTHKRTGAQTRADTQVRDLYIKARITLGSQN